MITNEKQQMQEIFDRVAIHLLIQDKQSKTRNGSVCAYRGADDTACSIGCLIDNKRYQKRFEGFSFNNPLLGTFIVQAVESSLGLSLGSSTEALLSSLQLLHDQHMPTLWHYKLCTIADHYELDKAAVDFALAYTNKVTE